MRPPTPTWECDYAHDRRQHAHRCRCCSKVLRAGERALMAKVSTKDTYAVHAVCADLPHGSSSATWRDAMETWGAAHLRALGYRLPA